jgi:Zn finger protein HypA/HybF involved in hydrogenase expression
MSTMHELGVCSSIVEAIERRAGERAVARVRVHVGRLQHVNSEAFEYQG